MGVLESRVEMIKKLDDFTEDMSNTFSRLVNEITSEITKSTEASYTDRLYNNGALSRFTQMGVTKLSADRFMNIFKMLGECDPISPIDKESIHALGQKYGFNEEESLCLYNMNRFEKAIDNLRAQRQLAYDYITGLKE